jgi:hypothetical protein
VTLGKQHPPPGRKKLEEGVEHVLLPRLASYLGARHPNRQPVYMSIFAVTVFVFIISLDSLWTPSHVFSLSGMSFLFLAKPIHPAHGLRSPCCLPRLTSHCSESSSLSSSSRYSAHEILNARNPLPWQVPCLSSSITLPSVGGE